MDKSFKIPQNDARYKNNAMWMELKIVRFENTVTRMVLKQEK